MATNSDLEKWQKAIQGIEASQNDLTPEAFSAFQALKELYNRDLFESSESGGHIQAIKNALPQYGKHRLLKVHLTHFVTLCEQYFTNRVVQVVSPAVQPPPSPYVLSPTPQEWSHTTPLSFGGILDEDITKWQKLIQEIEKLQNHLTPDELSAFATLRDHSCSGDFELNESARLIQVLKNHGRNRVLQKVYLPNFIALCEKYFNRTATPVIVTVPSNADMQTLAPEFEPPKIQPPVNPAIQTVPEQPEVKARVQPPPPIRAFPDPPAPRPENRSILPPEFPENNAHTTRDKGNKGAAKGFHAKFILIIALLVGGWYVYKNLDLLKAKLGLGQDAVSETVASHPLVGAWLGTLDNEEATLAFLSIDTMTQAVRAQIYFTGNSDTLRVSGTIKNDHIDLQDGADGIYRGKLDSDSLIFSGTFLGSTGASSTFSFRNPYKQTEEPPFDLGLWQGTLNQVPATLEFLSMTDGKVEAQIHFPGSNQTEKASGTMDSTVLNLTDEIENGFCDGVYTGEFQNDHSVFSGKFYDKNTGEAFDFIFSKYADIQVETDSVIPQEEIDRKEEEAKPVEEGKKNNPSSPSPSSSSSPASPAHGTVSVSGGSYKGDLKNGQPHGMGTVYYNTRILIDSRDIKKRHAEAGQYLVGQFRNGRLLQGKLFDSADNQIEIIIIGGGAY